MDGAAARPFPASPPGDSFRLSELLDYGVDRMRQAFWVYAAVPAALGGLSAILGAAWFVLGGRMLEVWLSTSSGAASWSILYGVMGGALGWILIQVVVTTVSFAVIGRLEADYIGGIRPTVRSAFRALWRVGVRAFVLGLSLSGLLGGAPLLVGLVGFGALWGARAALGASWTTLTIVALGVGTAGFGLWIWFVGRLSLAPSALAGDDGSVSFAYRRSSALVRGSLSKVLLQLMIGGSLAALAYALGFAWIDVSAFEFSSTQEILASLPSLLRQQAVGSTMVEVFLVPVRVFAGICWMGLFFWRATAAR